MKPVFVSHSSKDREVALKLAAALEGRGVGVWLAPRDVTPGANYAAAIIDAINDSKVLVVVLSAHANLSRHVAREVERAASKGHVIVPFRIEDVMPSRALELFLSSEHWLDAFGRPMEQALANLGEVLALLASVDFAPERAGELAAKASPAAREAARHLGHAKARPSRRALVATAAGAAIVLPLGVGAWLLARSEAAPDPKAVAVLPFENIGGDKALDYLRLAIPLELNTWLTQAKLVVRPLESVRKLETAAIGEVARALRVGTVIGGGFWSANGELHLKANVVNSLAERLVWSGSVESATANLGELIPRIIVGVSTALSDLIGAAAAPAAGGVVEAAYALYLRAQALAQDVTDANNTAAITLLKRAVELDPKFARAHALLAEAYVTRFWWNFSNDRAWVAQGEAAAVAAVTLEPESAYAHFALGFAAEAAGRRGDAVRAYFTSARLDPACLPALASVARYYFYMTDFKASIATLERIAAIDPTSNVHVRKAMCRYFLGDAAAAARENALAERRARGVDQLTLVGFTYAWLRNFAAVRRVLDALIARDPAALSILELRAWQLAMMGQAAAARAEMARILARRQTFGIRDEIATLHAVLGDVERAVPLLAEAVEAGAPNLAWYRSDFFKAARGHAAYEALIARLAAEYRAALADVGGG